MAHVIIDNGHGQETAGKRSPIWPDGTQLFEWKTTRKIASKLANLLAVDGIKSTILVPEYSDISLEQRVERANKIAALYPDAVLISIHCNAGGGTGFEAFTSTGNTKSDKLAEYIYDSMSLAYPKEKMRVDISDGDKDKESDFYILRKTICPAVLTENFFMDTESDCRKLLDDKHLDKIAHAHRQAIARYYR